MTHESKGIHVPWLMNEREMKGMVSYVWWHSFIWRNRVTCMNESWHVYEWVMARVWMSHGTCMNESWHSYEWESSHSYVFSDEIDSLMPRMWMSHGTYMNESWHVYDWVISRIWMRVMALVCLLWRQKRMRLTLPWPDVAHMWSHSTHMNESHGTHMSFVKTYECHDSHSYEYYTAQEWTNRTLISHERTSVHFLVLPGCLLSFTEITEYTYISLI